MAHTFLLQPGRWTLQGTWLEGNGLPINVKGMTLVAWNRDNWFTMATKLSFPHSDRPTIALVYKGRLDGGERQYSFLLTHNILGQIEGEGWLGLDTIVQRYWVLNDGSGGQRRSQPRSGFETLRQVSDNTYNLSSAMICGHYLTSIMEASLERHSS